MAQWGFLTNHAHVLLCVARGPDTRLRHVAECVGITERATHRIICDLVDAGYLRKHRLGRRSYYEVDLKLPLRHSLERDHELGDLLAPFLRRRPGDSATGVGSDGDTSRSSSAPSDVVPLRG